MGTLERLSKKSAAAILRVAVLCCASLIPLASYASSSLIDLYREALGSDPRLLAADAEADIYQAREKYRRGALLPQANASVQGTRTGREAKNQAGVGMREYYDGERYNFQLTQSLYNKSQWEGYRAAGHEADEYAARYGDTENLVTVDVVDRYTRVLAAEDHLGFVIAELESADKQLKQVRARYERQLAMVTDVLEVEARVDRLQTEKLQAGNEVDITREALSELIGRELNEPLAPLREQVYLDLDLDAPDVWIQRGLENNRSVEAARAAVKAAEAGLRQAQGERHPTVNLQLMAQKSDIGYENAEVPTTETYVAALNLNIPLYSGGQVSAQVAEARARVRLANQRQEEVERGLRKDIREAFLNARNASQRVASTHKALTSAEKSYEARQKGYQYGSVTVVDVLDAAEYLYGAQRDHRQAYYDLMVQTMNLYRAAGNDAPAQIAKLNSWLVAES